MTNRTKSILLGMAQDAAVIVAFVGIVLALGFAVWGELP